VSGVLPPMTPGKALSNMILPTNTTSIEDLPATAVEAAVKKKQIAIRKDSLQAFKQLASESKQ